jgi:hypothetical protein
MLMSTTTAIRIEGYGDADFFDQHSPQEAIISI